MKLTTSDGRSVVAPPTQAQRRANDELDLYDVLPSVTTGKHPLDGGCVAQVTLPNGVVAEGCRHELAEFFRDLANTYF